MKTNQEGLNLIKHFESLHDGDLKQIGLQPKMDPIGIWTEGYGRAMRDSKGNFIKGIENKKLAYSRISIKNEKEAEEALSQDLLSREHIVVQNIKIPLNENQFSALTSYVYNTGGSTTLYRLINQKSNRQDIEYWWDNHYITSGNIIMKGLILRRNAESDLYFKQI
jgi:lysozyme